MEAYVVTYTLEYLKRSGRINSVAGIMGDVLNIKRYSISETRRSM